MASATTSLLRAGRLSQAVTRRRCSHADLDTERFIRHIEDTLLNLLVDLFRSVDEGLPRARRVSNCGCKSLNNGVREAHILDIRCSLR